MSLSSLLELICREFELSTSDVVKIRRQIEDRNVVIRTDQELRRLPNESFIEAVLKRTAKPTFPTVKMC
jgi:hypothetical protein